MTMRPILIFAVLLAGGACKSGGKSAPKAAPPELDRCLTQLEKLFAPGGIELGGTVGPDGTIQPTTPGPTAQVATACRDVFPRCGEAFDALGSGKATVRDFSIICVHRYCGELPDPKPPLCDDEPKTDPEALAQGLAASARFQWGEALDPLAPRGRALVAQAAKAMEQPIEEIAITPAAPTGGGAAHSLLIAADGYWLAVPGGAPQHIAKTKAGWDLPALTDALARLQQAELRASVEIAADDAVPYQELITAMDKAIANGMRDAQVVDRASLSTPLPPDAKAATSAPCPDRSPEPTTQAQPQAASTELPARQSLAKAPIIVIPRDGEATVTYDGGDKVAFSAAKGCDWKIPALFDSLAAHPRPDGYAVLQADKDTPASSVMRVLKTTYAAGFASVMFAVKRSP